MGDERPDQGVTLDDPTRPIPPEEILAAAQRCADEDLLGDARIGRWALEWVIAAGGGGTVYQARHVEDGRRAALKVLRREMAESPDLVQRFLREVVAVHLVKHPNIVDILDFGALPDGRPYYAMERLEGADLKQYLAARGRLLPGEALAILEPVCGALEAAHAAGIVHRDLKGSNIHIGDAPGRMRIKLLDFGVAKIPEAEPPGPATTQTITRLGTSYTMAPEQILGTAVSRATDVYALGVVLYQVLTGRYPFASSSTRELEMMHLSVPPPRPSAVVAEVSAAIDAVVLRAMEKRPDRRYPSTPAFAEALRAAVVTR